MKIYKILFPLTIISMMSVTSCNKGFSRINFKEVEYSDFKTTLDSIFENQTTKDNHTTLFDDGSIKFSYDFSLRGFCRVEDFSFNDLDIAFNGEVNFAWSKGNNYLKISSPKEIVYYIKSEKDDNWYRARELEKGEKYSKMKQVIDPITNFCDLVVEKADYQLALGYDSLIFEWYVMPTIKVGLTGNQDDSSYWYIISPKLICTDPDYRELIQNLHSWYDQGKHGDYYINERYGSDGKGSASVEIKTKMNLYDNKNILPGPWLEPLSEKTLSGYADINYFNAWKDNFIYQNELIADCRVIHSKESNIDIQVKLNMREEVSDKCTPDDINLDDYGEEE